MPHHLTIAYMVARIVRGATVFDGTGAPPLDVDIAIVGDRLRVLRRGEAIAGAQDIDGTGKVLAPGFIDIHAHDDITPLAGTCLNDKVVQGVTTVVNGNCGFSPFPMNETNRALQSELLSIISPAGWEAKWTNARGYLEAAVTQGLPTNVIVQVGHGALRSAVMGMAARKATPSELDAMAALLRDGLDQGASGLSFGLMYHPSGYADAEEMYALCRVVADKEAFVSIHLRSYDADHLIAGMEEIADICARTGARLQFSHLCPTGRDGEALVEPMLAVIDNAAARGLDTAFDRYPYQHAFTVVSLLLSPNALAAISGDAPPDEALLDEIDARASGYGYAAIRVAGTGYGNRNGASIAEIADARRMRPAQAIIAIAREFGVSAPITIELSSMAVQEQVIRHPSCMVGSDGVPTLEATHPRTFGTFPRVVGPMVRSGVLHLAQAIHKMTGQPAQWLGLTDRGVIREGAYADLVLFDPMTVSDTGSFDDAYAPPLGIELVVLNGEIVFDDGRPAAVRAGRPLSPRRAANPSRSG